VGLQAGDQLPDPDRLGQVVVGAGVEASDGARLIVAPGDEDDRHQAVERPQAPAGFDAGDVGQYPVEEDGDGVVADERLDRLMAAAGAGDHEALLLDQVRDQVRGGHVVLDDQDYATGAAHLPSRHIRGRRDRASGSPRS